MNTFSTELILIVVLAIVAVVAVVLYFIFRKKSGDTSEKQRDSQKVMLEMSLVMGDKESRDGSGKSIFLQMVANGFSDSLKSAIEQGVDVNSSDNSGQTAMHLAAKYGDAKTALDMVEQLIANNVFMDTRDNKGRTPFLNAAEADNVEVCKL